MSAAKIDKLTLEQEALVPVYQEKWRRFAVATEPIDRQKAADAAKLAYRAIAKEPPLLVFCDSPAQILSAIAPSGVSGAGNQGNQLNGKLESQLKSQLESQLKLELWWRLESQFYLGFHRLWSRLKLQIDAEQPELLFFVRTVDPALGSYYSSLFDFCISVLNCTVNRQQWLAYQAIVQECGFSSFFENICVACVKRSYQG